jgi:hypothetical protein
MSHSHVLAYRSLLEDLFFDKLHHLPQYNLQETHAVVDIFNSSSIACVSRSQISPSRSRSAQTSAFELCQLQAEQLRDFDRAVHREELVPEQSSAHRLNDGGCFASISPAFGDFEIEFQDVLAQLD